MEVPTNPDVQATTSGAIPRLPLVPPEPDDPIVQQVFALYRRRGRTVSDFYRVLANAPEVLQGWTRLGWPLRHEVSAARDLRELAIMRIALLTDCVFEWQSHWDMAVEAGLTPSQLRALADWSASTEFTGDQRLVLAFTDEMVADVEVSEATFVRVADRFTPQEVVELTVTAAFYVCVARVLRTLGIPSRGPEDPRVATYLELASPRDDG